MGLVIELLRPVAWLLSRLLFKIRFYGVENVPKEGACILTPNHESFADPIWITIPIRRRVRYMAWERFFQIPLLGFVMRTFGAFPVKLETTDTAAQREAIELIKQGGLLVIFPEGGRTRTGKLMPFKAGAFRLALAHGVPIVPVTINGGYKIWSIHRLLPRPGRLTITYHPPIAVEKFSESAGRIEMKEQARELARQTRTVVASTLDPANIEPESATVQ
jgi:1-acyl-sn-glycerol-3-phosphate acyltransferase